MTQIPSDQVNNARAQIEQSQDVVIAVASNPTLDTMAAALSIYLALSSQGKRVMVVSSNPTTVGFSHLIGIDKVTSNFSGGTQGKNLVVSFPYQEGSIEKVSYNIEADTFNLVIEPRENYPIITPEMIRYSYSGGNTDLIITVGVATLSDLGSLYQTNQSLFSEKTIVNIDIAGHNSRFGKVNVVDPTSSSVSELLTHALGQLGFQMDPDMATNLYQGIMEGSDNFTSPNTNASTFDAASICMKNGARKQVSGAAPAYQDYQFPTPPPAFPKPFKPTPPPSMRQQVSPYPKPFPSPFKQQMPKPASFGQNGPQLQHPPSYQPSMPPPTNYQQPHNQPSQLDASKQRPQPPQQQQGQNQKSDAPPDWLKPKIYKGSTLL